MEYRHTAGRLPDLHNPPKPRWGQALKALWGPAQRLHDYRTLHTAMLDDATCRIDCKKC